MEICYADLHAVLQAVLHAALQIIAHAGVQAAPSKPDVTES